MLRRPQQSSVTTKFTWLKTISGMLVSLKKRTKGCEMLQTWRSAGSILSTGGSSHTQQISQGLGDLSDSLASNPTAETARDRDLASLDSVINQQYPDGQCSLTCAVSLISLQMECYLKPTLRSPFLQRSPGLRPSHACTPTPPPCRDPGRPLMTWSILVSSCWFWMKLSGLHHQAFDVSPRRH